MDVLEPTINTPLSVSKKKAVIAHTSAKLKKTIEHTPAKNDWSWLNNASVDDLAQFTKDKGRFGKNYSWMESDEGKSFGALAFYNALTRKPIRETTKNDPSIYKKIFGVDKQIDWSWLNSASIKKITQFIKDNGRYGKGVRRMNSPKGQIAGACAFNAAIKQRIIRDTINNNPIIYKQVFGVKQKTDRSWLDSASVDDISQYMKDKGRGGKGHSWMISPEGQIAGANGFLKAIMKRSIRKTIQSNSENYKQVFGVEQKTDLSWLDNASINDIAQFMKDKGRFGKGSSWMNSPAGQIAGASGFYSVLLIKSIRKTIQNDSKIYKEIFGVKQKNTKDWVWLDSASADDIAQFMKDKGRFGKGLGWMQSPEGISADASTFYSFLRKKIIRKVLQNNPQLYKQTFGKSPYKRLYQDDAIDIGFDSLEERRIAIILYKLGIVEKWEEGENLHIRTNGSAKNSVDFKIGGMFLEYHPYHKHFKNKGGSFTGEAQRKYDHITNPRYKDKLDLIVFDDKIAYYDKNSHTWKQKKDLCRSLFNIITETPALISRIPLDKRWIILDYKHFKEFYNQVAKELSDYDMQSTSIESQE